MSVDLTAMSPNGAGGLCYPWNGTGVLTIAKTGDMITLPGEGTICQIGTSTSSLSAQGTFDYENGTGGLANAAGQGTLAFTTEMAATPTTSDPAARAATAIKVIDSIISWFKRTFGK
jgi:hypothetical protein